MIASGGAKAADPRSELEQRRCYERLFRIYGDALMASASPQDDPPFADLLIRLEAAPAVPGIDPPCRYEAAQPRRPLALRFPRPRSPRATLGRARPPA